MNYSVVVYDENGTRLAALNNTRSPRYSRSKNTADQVSFQLPRNDSKLTLETFVGSTSGPLTADTSLFTVDTTLITADATVAGAGAGGDFSSLFRVGRRFEILRAVGGESTFLECSGFVSSNGYDEDYYTVDGFTEEILLTQVLTPPQYGYPLFSENQTIDALVSQLDRVYLIEQIKWDWGDYIVANTNIDTSINPTFLILNTISTDPETGEPTYEPTGSVTFRFTKEADETWERIRWVSDYFERDGNQVTTMVSYRQAATVGALGSFSTPQAGVLTDVVGLIIADPDPAVLEVKVDFASTDANISPVLFALETIKRKAWAITEVEVIGNANTLATPGLSADSEPFFDVLTAALEPHGWEFSVLDGKLTVSETFGVNRTNDYSVVAG